jgi:hypothetical protein
VPTTPYTFTAGDDATSARLNTHATAILELQTVSDLCELTTTTTVALAASITTWQDVTFDTEVYDPAGMHTGSSATITIHTSGQYDCLGGVAFAPGTDSLGRGGRFLVNGATAYRIFQAPAIATAGVGTIYTGGRRIYLSAGDTIKLQAASGTAISTAAADTHFSVSRISA